jgi:carbon monoxide dehydrogenase subunit G
MELKGERRLPVGRDTAWKELNDTETLRAAVPGCESLVAVGDSDYEVAVNAAIGPVRSRFKGRLQLADIDAPNAYTVKFDLQGGAAGFSRGEARVTLEAAGANETMMRYDVKASIGGRIAQIGSRLVDAAAATMADRFFAAFAAGLANKYPTAAAAGAPAAVIARPPGLFATLWAFLRRLFGGRG